MLEKKILILGASGFIGHRMYSQLGPEKAIGTYCKAPAPAEFRFFDAMNHKLADIVSPDEIDHCMVFYGDSFPDSCGRDPVRSNALNVESTKKVIDQLVEWKIHFTFSSSEAVFDGSAALSDETTPTNPIMLYGQQKLDIEKYLQATHPDAAWTVMRFGKVYGDNTENDKLFGGWISAIDKKQKIRIATDQAFSPIFVDDVINGCVTAAHKRETGVFCLCGTERHSRHELLYMLIDSVKRYRSIDVDIEPCSIDDFDLAEPRPKDISMRPDKIIAATGITITPTSVICDRVVDDHFSKVKISQ